MSGGEASLDTLLDDALEQLEQAETVPVKKEQLLNPSTEEADLQRMLGEFEALLGRQEGVNGADPDDTDTTDEGTDAQAINQIIEQMMGELTSKQVLYEPFKDLSEKLPQWLSERQPDDDLDRHRRQLELVKGVVGIFERSDYEQGKQGYQQKVFELMQQIQDLGPLPADLVGPDSSDHQIPECKLQ